MTTATASLTVGGAAAVTAAAALAALGRLPAALAIAVGLALGLALGAAYVAALRWNVRLYVTPGARGLAIALHGARAAGVVAVLGLAVWLGAPALVATAIGFTATRLALVRAEVR